MLCSKRSALLKADKVQDYSLTLSSFCFPGNANTISFGMDGSPYHGSPDYGSPNQVGPYHVGPDHVGPDHFISNHIGPYHVGPNHVGPDHFISIHSSADLSSSDACTKCVSYARCARGRSIIVLYVAEFS